MSTNNQTSVLNTTGFDRYIVRYGSIFLFIVGTFGNIVSFIIFSKGILRKSSTFRYLALLSLMDLVVLYSGLLDLLLVVENGGKFSLRTLHPMTCRFHTFLTYWSQHSSSWILSSISVDRAIATNCIKFARKFCTPRSADYIVGMILLLIALFNSHELIFLRLQSSIISRTDQPTGSIDRFSTPVSFISYGDYSMPKKRDIERLFSICDNSPWNFLCQRNKRDLSSVNLTTTLISFKARAPPKYCEPPKGSNYEYFWDHVWEWIDVCLYAVIPFTVMSIGTFLIVYRVYYQQRRIVRSRRSGTNNPMGLTPNKAKSLFYLLFTLNLLYFILVSPVVFVTTLFRNRSEELAYPRFKSIVYLMQYCNHSLNFIFYGITSPPYRRTLYEWFRLLIPHLPQWCQKKIRERSKSYLYQNDLQNKTLKEEKKKKKKEEEEKKDSISLIPRKN